MARLFLKLNKGNLKLISTADTVEYHVLQPTSPDYYEADFVKLPNGDIDLTIQIAENYQDKVLIETNIVPTMPIQAQIDVGNVDIFSLPSSILLNCNTGNVMLDRIRDTCSGINYITLGTGNTEIKNVKELLVRVEIEIGRVNHSNAWKPLENIAWKGLGVKGAFQIGSSPQNEFHIKIKVGNVLLS